MKIVAINAIPYGSTGNIMFQIIDLAKDSQLGNVEAFTFSKRLPCKREENEYIGTEKSNLKNAKLSAYTGLDGYFCIKDTKKLLKRLDEINPDIIHLHNLHGYFLNYKLLFSWIKKNKKPVVWTLHDCWAFTGHCPHFDIVNCQKWQSGCKKCHLYKEYPQSKIDNSSFMWKKKKKWFGSVQNMTIVTPSNWLKSLAEKSFLSQYQIEVINNGINTDVFKPTTSEIRKQLGIDNQFVLVGVSFDFGVRKGLDCFVELSKQLSEDYKIVLVGIDKQKAKDLPKNIICIEKTQNQQELAKIYSMADLFVNPTREDNYPTVNMEAIACGTPVITFNTGGSPEIIEDGCGIVVEKNDVQELIDKIKQTKQNYSFDRQKIAKIGESFSLKTRLKKYVDLYQKILEEKK